MSATASQSAISERKLEHLQLALSNDVESPNQSAWRDVRLIHQALPGFNLSDVDMSCEFLGSPLRAPVWITGMTGGHERAAQINVRLAIAAQKYGLAMWLGSQRAGLSNSSLMDTYEVARIAAPEAVLIANIGAPQLIAQGTAPPLQLADVQSLIDSIQAQALAIHLNYLQECVQSEGDTDAAGVTEAIGGVVRAISVPVMAKETGAGVSRETAIQLARMGVAAVDVAGWGGTSMVRIEGARPGQHESGHVSISSAFEEWGIPTPAAILESRGCGLAIVATGGVRTGVDAARALALGADAVGVGLPFLRAAAQSEEALDTAIQTFLKELRAALFLTASRTPADLKQKGAVVHGELFQWKTQRGL